MAGTVHANAQAYGLDTGKRHLLTQQNLVELGITWDSLQPLLNADNLKIDGQSPDGISINEMTFGNYSGPTAATLGWIGYMTIGAPLIEELADIIQPPADMLSNRTYLNRAQETRHFQDSVEFSISNTINWSLGGTAQLTFGGRASATMEEQLQRSLALSLAKTTAHTHIEHNHKDNVGTQDQDLASQTTTGSTTVTGTGSSSGTGELFSQLMLGISGSVGGSLSTSLTASSSVSGDIGGASRVETIATQRRQVKHYIYELPISLAGYVSLHYAKPVPANAGETPPQDPTDPSDKPVNLIARNIQRINLVQSGKSYRPKGIAETVSALNVEHTIFASESIASANDNLNTKQPHYL